MNKNYQKVIFSFVVVSILLFWNSKYAFLYIIGFMMAMLYILYDTNTSYYNRLIFIVVKKKMRFVKLKVKKILIIKFLIL